MNLLKLVGGSIVTAVVSVSCAYIGLGIGGGLAHWMLGDKEEPNGPFWKELNAVKSLVAASKTLHVVSPEFMGIRKNPTVAADMFRLTERTSLRTKLYSDAGGMMDRIARNLPQSHREEFNKLCDMHIEDLVDSVTTA
jgi:hypothetical protein